MVSRRVFMLVAFYVFVRASRDFLSAGSGLPMGILTRAYDAQLNSSQAYAGLSVFEGEHLSMGERREVRSACGGDEPGVLARRSGNFATHYQGNACRHAWRSGFLRCTRERPGGDTHCGCVLAPGRQSSNASRSEDDGAKGAASIGGAWESGTTVSERVSTDTRRRDVSDLSGWASRAAKACGRDNGCNTGNQPLIVGARAPTPKDVSPEGYCTEEHFPLRIFLTEKYSMTASRELVGS